MASREPSHPQASNLALVVVLRRRPPDSLQCVAGLFDVPCHSAMLLDDVDGVQTILSRSFARPWRPRPNIYGPEDARKRQVDRHLG